MNNIVCVLCLFFANLFAYVNPCCVLVDSICSIKIDHMHVNMQNLQRVPEVTYFSWRNSFSRKLNF